MLDCITSTTLLAANAARSGQRQRLGEGVDFERKQQIHRQLDGLTSAIRSHMEPALGDRGKDRLDASDGLGGAADHHHQFALFRAPGAAGDWRVQIFDAALGTLRSRLPR